MTQKTYEVSFNDFFGSVRTCIMRTGNPEVLYEFIEYSRHQAIIRIQDWIEQQKELTSIEATPDTSGISGSQENIQ